VKRILALSGGGLRGIVEVAFLEAIEAEYQRRHGSATRICDVFDLIGGTSTGALIASALALGKPASEIAAFYRERASFVFRQRGRWKAGLAPVFDARRLEAEIRKEVGDITLGDPALQTKLAIVTKRLDTASPWIVTNIPSAPYFDDPPDGSYLGNRHYAIARLLRASAAAPGFFRQETMPVRPGEPPGVFVDGGASPFNDPSLALFKLARMRAFGLRWPLGSDRLFILSIGSGHRRLRLSPEHAARARPLQVARDALKGLVHDSEVEAVTLMSWLGRPLAPQPINSEVGSLADDDALDAPQFAYLRLNLPLEQPALAGAGLDTPDDELARLARFGDPAIVEPLYTLARDHCARAAHLRDTLM